MCAPPAIFAVGAAAVSAAGKVGAGFTAASQYRAQAKVDRENARIATDAANDSATTTALSANRRYRAAAQLAGAQQASMAANGIDLGFGSAVQVADDTRMIAAEDVGQIYREGAEKMKGLDREAWSYRASSDANRSRASGAIVGGVFGATATVLSGASQYSQMRGK